MKKRQKEDKIKSKLKQKAKTAVRNKPAVKKLVPKTKRKISLLDLKRSHKNPIIQPAEGRFWESKATFNPTAIFHDGKVHIIYRAIGDSDNSVLGYAASGDGHSFDADSKELAYYRKNIQSAPKADPKINYCSGGGWGGGCEDPRLTLLEGTVHLLYTSFDGWGSVRMAMTSISLDDFISRRWNWRDPVLISPPNQIHKNWVLFPEKISRPAFGGKGKYAILHSISPTIMIDYFDSLKELDGNNFIHSIHQGSPLWKSRDKFVRGVGPSPLKTKYGWLVLYHKTERHDSHRYKLWAMILDLQDPTKILHDSSQPILEPDEWYENEGYKGGVVYSCGAVIKGKELFVYYGGADKVSCVATADLDAFLKELAHSRSPLLKTKKAEK